MFGPTQREIETRDADRLFEYEIRKKADLEKALAFYIERCQTLAEQIEEAVEIKLNKLKTSFANYILNKHFSDSYISIFSTSDNTLALGRVRHAAENDDVSRSQPILETPVSVEPGKERITEFQETLHEDSVQDTHYLDTQNGSEKDGDAVVMTSHEAIDERCLVRTLVARIWTPRAFVSPFHRPPRKPPPEELSGPGDVTPTSSTPPLRPPPKPPPDQV
jgi:hypothetical protein